jgi:phospholipid/cholesterol/gamma-HCH transport system substrate-binding protein
MNRVLRSVAALITVSLATSGCSVLSGGLRGVDLPGGAALGDNPYTVSIEFPDVVDLVPQSLVKVADVAVGTVSGIEVDPKSWNAIVTVQVNGDVKLPADATATVSTTSLLGEKFVQLAPPSRGAVPMLGPASDPSVGTLANGATIPVDRAGRGAEVEEVLGALSMLLNGGGVAQIKTISTELNQALVGNEPEVRSLLANLNELVSALDDRKGDITRALDGLNRLSATLNGRRGQIANALDNLSPGLKELENQRGELVDLLQSLDRLSGVATDVVTRSRDDTIADLRSLRPTLQKLAESGQDLPDSLQILGSFPFTDAAEQAVAGDYANLYLTVDLDLKSVLDNLARSNQPFPGPDTPLFGQLPPTAQLLSPLLGSSSGTVSTLGPASDPSPKFPLLGPVPTRVQDTPAPSPTPRPGLLGRLFGGGS